MGKVSHFQNFVSNFYKSAPDLKSNYGVDILYKKTKDTNQGVYFVKDTSEGKNWNVKKDAYVFYVSPSGEILTYVDSLGSPKSKMITTQKGYDFIVQQYHKMYPEALIDGSGPQWDDFLKRFPDINSIPNVIGSGVQVVGEPNQQQMMYGWGKASPDVSWWDSTKWLVQNYKTLDKRSAKDALKLLNDVPVDVKAMKHPYGDVSLYDVQSYLSSVVFN